MTARRDDDLRAELEAHVAMAAAERVAWGETPEAAERAARREFGNLTHVSEVTREQHRGVSLERFVQDIRYGIRSLRRTPTFTVAAVLTLALAIGANSAVFSVVNGVLLRPLPFPDPDRLFLVSYLPKDLPWDPPPGLVDRQWLDYRQRQRAFERVTGYTRRAGTLTGAGDAARLAGARVDANFFGVLRISPAIGRGFTPDDNGEDVVVLGDRIWRERFSADPRIVGRAVHIDGVSHVVVGVMPSGFGFPGSAEFWTPLRVTLNEHNSFILSVLGRLRERGSTDEARQELEALAEAMPRDPKDHDGPMEAAILPLKSMITGKIAPALFVFTGAVAFVLLIACVNVANLLLIRAASRRREMAVRVALGAGRLRLLRQLLTESALVGVAGGVLGILVAQLGVRALLAIAPDGRIPRVDEVRVDGTVLAFTLVVSLVTGVAFGVVPALQSARQAPQEAMAHGGRTVGTAHGRLRASLVAIEVALALVLLTGAALMIKSFLRMRGVDKGYDARHVVAMTVDLPSLRYGDAPRQRAFHDRMLAELAAIPSVQDVGAVTFKPMSDVGMMGDFVVEGASPTPHGFGLDKLVVSPGYFPSMGVRLVRGREFTTADDARAEGVIIVSESVARRVWPGSDPIGKRVSMEDKPTSRDWLTVVGVAADVVQDRSMEKHSAMYFPYAQSSWTFVMSHTTYVVRSDIGTSVAPAMRAALRRADPDIPAQKLQTMDEALLDVVADPLFQTRLLGAFSFIAMLLAAIGTYGVLAYDVAERSREIALRMALGAQPGTVIAMVMRRTVTLAVAGATLGVLASLGLTHVLTKSLYDVKPTDPGTLVSVVAGIVVVALLAGLVPARRASRVRVLTALSD
ncbi:MAG TPA: ABC transporter permease [Gemmatimonadaceae bacterium]|nr:ABC transporter permease [Gemmatimonadaceae bacterium]